MDISNLLGFGSNLLNNIVGAGTSIFNNERSLRYTRDLQQQLFARDDTAIQRRMADYQAAGINPLLALGGSGAGNTSAGGVSFESFTPTFDYLGRQGKFIENQILKSKQKEQDYVNDSLWLKNEEQKLKNAMLQKEKDAMDNLDYYPFSALGKWMLDANSILGTAFGVSQPNFLNPGSVINSILPNMKPISINTAPGSTFVRTQDQVASAVNNFVNKINPISNEFKFSKETNINLAKTLNKAWKDNGFHVMYTGGKFRVENFNTRPPESYDFETYQQASQYIWSLQN